MATTIELIITLAVILGAAIVFTNAIELLGERLNLGSGAVGSVLAAVGTALPETMIPVIAIVGTLILGGDAAASQEIGIGAIIGAPFTLATLALFVVGASALGFRRRRETGAHISVDERVTSLDIGFFFIFFAIAAAVGLVELPLYGKILVAILFVGSYVLYVVRILQHGGETQGEPPGKLFLWRPFRGEAPTWAVVAQVVGAIVIMAVGAHFFVQAVEHVSTIVGIPAVVIALIIAPLATELPEKFNSVIWLRESKDTLALGNISGAMAFQSTIPVAIGILFTPWNLGFLPGLAAVFALVSGAILFFNLRAKQRVRSTYLLGGGILYIAFLVVAAISTFA